MRGDPGSLRRRARACCASYSSQSSDTHGVASSCIRYACEQQYTEREQSFSHAGTANKRTNDSCTHPQRVMAAGPSTRLEKSQTKRGDGALIRRRPVRLARSQSRLGQPTALAHLSTHRISAGLRLVFTFSSSTRPHSHTSVFIASRQCRTTTPIRLHVQLFRSRSPFDRLVASVSTRRPVSPSLGPARLCCVQ